MVLHCCTDTGPIIFLPPATLAVMFLLDMSLWAATCPDPDGSGRAPLSVINRVTSA